MTPEQSVMLAIAICLVGAVLTLVVSRSRTAAGWLAFAVTATAAGVVLAATTQVLSHGPSAHPSSFWAIPLLHFELRIHVDGLTSIFLLLAAVISVPAALYSIPYMRHYADYGVGRYYPHFLVFLAAMYGLVSTTDMMWFFFVFWQMMTLTGYALIRFENRNRACVHAANKYLIMMQIACAATMVGAEMLAVSGARVSGAPGLKYDFDTVSANLPSLLAASPGVTAVAFALFLVGFGIKMGMWPFGQVWLPDAHPAAPSPVSAMLSGVMIKTGVYGLMRYFIWLVPTDALSNYPLATWALIVVLLGTVTLFTGTMQALRQEQTKRLLAFHSIGQVGYILLGTGACMALLPSGSPAMTSLAAVALFGALFHVINHALFKSLLFLNAGSMLYATGTQDLNKLGGLMRYMPITGVTAFIASFSIAGVPLFNGFASKWSIYVATIQGHAASWVMPFCAVVAIITSALTLASFVKFAGGSFLSRSSALVEGAAAKARLEVGWLMQAPQVCLAFACVTLGLLPALGWRITRLALDTSRHGLGGLLADGQPMATGYRAGLADPFGEAVFAPLALAMVLAVTYLGAHLLSRLGGSRRRADVPWLCGYARESEANRYAVHGFYGEIKRYFGWVGGAPRLPAVDHGPRRDD